MILVINWTVCFYSKLTLSWVKWSSFAVLKFASPRVALFHAIFVVEAFSKTQKRKEKKIVKLVQKKLQRFLKYILTIFPPFVCTNSLL